MIMLTSSYMFAPLPICADRRGAVPMSIPHATGPEPLSVGLKLPASHSVTGGVPQMPSPSNSYT